MFMIAAPDTTSALINALLASVLSNPKCLTAIRNEVAARFAQHGDGSRYCAWSDIARLPYFMACVNEALRLYPPIPFVLPRRVSPGGIIIKGQHIPEGTEIGTAAAAINRNEEVFGPYPDEWRPERWLVDEPSVSAKRQRLLFSWGWGTRRCLGKNLALLQACKLVLHVGLA